MLKKLKILWKLIPLMWICNSCTPIADCYSYCSDLCQYVTEIPYFCDSDCNVLKIQFETNHSTNNGTPFYVLVKSTDFPQFLREDYQTIADLVAQPTEDPLHLATLCMIPGTTKTIKLKAPKDKSTAIYCLFTCPGEVWKYMIDFEEGSQKMRIQLGKQEIKSIERL